MLKIEYRILKYINSHPDKKRDDICKKFKLNSFEPLDQLSEYVTIQKLQSVKIDDGFDSFEQIIVGTSTYRTNHLGQEYIESRKHNFWTFFLPYTITTIIAVGALALQLLSQL